MAGRWIYVYIYKPNSRQVIENRLNVTNAQMTIGDSIKGKDPVSTGKFAFFIHRRDFDKQATIELRKEGYSTKTINIEPGTQSKAIKINMEYIYEYKILLKRNGNMLKDKIATFSGMVGKAPFTGTTNNNGIITLRPSSSLNQLTMSVNLSDGTHSKGITLQNHNTITVNFTGPVKYSIQVKQGNVFISNIRVNLIGPGTKSGTTDEDGKIDFSLPYSGGWLNQQLTVKVNYNSKEYSKTVMFSRQSPNTTYVFQLPSTSELRLNFKFDHPTLNKDSFDFTPIMKYTTDESEKGLENKGTSLHIDNFNFIVGPNKSLPLNGKLWVWKHPTAKFSLNNKEYYLKSGSDYNTLTPKVYQITAPSFSGVTKTVDIKYTAYEIPPPFITKVKIMENGQPKSGIYIEIESDENNVSNSGTTGPNGITTFEGLEPNIEREITIPSKDVTKIHTFSRNDNLFIINITGEIQEPKEIYYFEIYAHNDEPLKDFMFQIDNETYYTDELGRTQILLTNKTHNLTTAPYYGITINESIYFEPTYPKIYIFMKNGKIEIWNESETYKRGYLVPQPINEDDDEDKDEDKDDDNGDKKGIKTSTKIGIGIGLAGVAAGAYYLLNKD